MKIVFLLLAALTTLESFTVLGARCFCGETKFCRFDHNGNPIAEECSLCSDFTRFIYQDDCKTLMNHCKAKPCSHRGVCTPVLGSFYCSCPPHHYGINCSIFDRELTLTRLTGPAVFFPLNVPPEARRIVYVSVKDFGDQFWAEIAVNDDTIFQVDEYSFERGNMRQACERYVKQFPDYSDEKICDTLANEETNIFTFPHHPVKELTGRRVVGERMNTTLNDLVGISDKLSVVLNNGEFVNFNHTYSLFVQFSSLDVICFHKIDFVSCSRRKDDAFVFQERETIVIGAITEIENSCEPFVEVVRKWYRLKYSNLKEIPGETTKTLTFPENSLSSGFHEFHFEFAIKADPPRYGSNKITENFGIVMHAVTANIMQGQLSVAIEGGEEQTYPCNQPIKLKAINLNKNFRIADMNFTWVCSNSQDIRCSPIHSKGFVNYPMSREGCGQTYTFYVFVNHPTEDQNTTAKARIKFDPRIKSQIKITCEDNCLSHTKAGRAVTLAARSEPFVRGHVTFDITQNKNGTFNMKRFVELRETNNDPIVFFPPQTLELNDTILTVTVTKLGVSAKLKINITSPPKPPNCTFTPEGELYHVECSPQNPDEYGIFYLYDKSPGETTQDAVAVSSTGNFGNQRIAFSNVLVNFLNFYGDASQTRFEIQGNFSGSDALISVEDADLMASEGDFVGLLRMASIASRLLCNASVTPDNKTHASENMTLVNSLIDVSRAILKTELFKREDMTETAFNTISRIIKMRTEIPVKASEILWFCSEVIKKVLNEVKSMVRKEFVHIFRLDSLERNTQFLNTIVQLFTYRDPFVENSGHIKKAESQQFYKRLTERSSVNLLEALECLASIDQSYMVYMSDPTWYTLEEPFCAQFGLIGTLSFISSFYSTFDYGVMSIEEYNYTGMDNVHQHPLLFQVYIFYEDIFWWHRYVTIDSVTIKARLEDFETKRPVPPSTTQFTVTIPILAKSKHKLDTLSIKGTAVNPPLSAENKEAFAAIYMFIPPIGQSTLYYFFTGCTSPHGCRVSFTYNRVPSYSDDLNVNPDLDGSVLIDENLTEQVRYYFAVLPGPELDEIYADNETDTPIAVCKCKHMSWFAVTIPKIVFKRVFFSTMHVEAIASSKLYVMIITSIILFLFVLLALWCWYMDKRDVRKKLLRIMKTSSPLHDWEYIVGVFSKPTVSTTTSKIGLRLVGSATCSSVGLISFGLPKASISVEDEWFSMGSNQQVGRLEGIHLWHNHSGCSPSWNCEKILIYDVRQNSLYSFTIEKLFTVNQSNDDSQMTEQVADKINNFDETVDTEDGYFLRNFKLELANKHRTLSFYFKSPRNIRTRLECLAIFAVFFSTFLCALLLFWSQYSGIINVDTKTFSISLTIRISVLSLIIAYITTMIVSEMFWASKGNRMRSTVNFTRRSTIKHSTKSSTSSPSRRTVVTKSSQFSNTSKSFASNRGMGENFRNFLHGDSPNRPHRRSRGNQIFHSFKGHLNRRSAKCFAHFVHPITYSKILHDDSAFNPQPVEVFKKILIATWIVTIGIVVINFSLILGVGNHIQPNLAMRWLGCAILFFLIDIFLLDPLKILFFTWILLVVLKKSDVEVNTVCFDPTKESFEAEKCSDYLAFIKKRTQADYKPMSWTKLERIRKRRRIIKWLLLSVFAVISIVLLSIILNVISTYGIKTSYITVKYIRACMNSKKPPLDDVYSKIELNKFVLHTFIPNINVLEWYNHRLLWRRSSLETRERIFETKTYSVIKGSAFSPNLLLVGPFRVRQHRVEEVLPPPAYFANWFNNSYEEIWYSVFVGWINVDKEDYCEGWFSARGCLPYTRLWTFEPSSLLYEKGRFKWYPDGGYARTIEWAVSLATMKFTDLLLDNWIDNRTRVVFVDFTLFNLNLNLLTIGVITFETLSSGLCTNRIDLESLHPPSWANFPKESSISLQYDDYTSQLVVWRAQLTGIGFAFLLLVVAFLISLKFVFPFCGLLLSTVIPAMRIFARFFLLIVYLTLIAGKFLVESSSIEVADYNPIAALLRLPTRQEESKFTNLPLLIICSVFILTLTTGLLIALYIDIIKKGRGPEKRGRRKKLDDYKVGKSLSDVIMEHVVAYELVERRLKSLDAKFRTLY